MNESLAAKIRNAPNLPSLPAIAIQILDLAQRSEVDMAEIARIISRDPALCGKILRTVNSSFYSRSNHVSTISHALVILGLQSIRTLVLSFSLVSNLSGGRTRGFEHIAYWRRSLFAATAARVVAETVRFPHQEEAFLATLLADIGMLVLDQVMGEGYGPVHEKVATHEELCAAEQATIGATHAEVGGMLARMWRLPPVLCEPIEHHHAPEHVEDHNPRSVAELVQLAGRCADVFIDPQAAPAIADVRRWCLERYRIAEADCDLLLDDIAKRTQELAGLFEITIGSVTEYEAVLRKANQALVELTLQVQRQAKLLAAQASDLAEQTTSLQRQNVRLQQQATIDSLTGLANRAKFDTFLAERLAAAVEKSQPIALLMIDLDRFKGVNDRFGHPAGDTVLRAVAKILRGAVRQQDLAARYGGDEMVLVLANISRTPAAALAEALRRRIAGHIVHAGKAQVKVTASIGVAMWEPGSPFSTPAHLIRAADLAVYNAKQSGGDRARVLSLRSAGSPAVAVTAVHAS